MYHKAILHKQRSPLCDWLEVECSFQKDSRPELVIRIMRPHALNRQIFLNLIGNGVSLLHLQNELFYLYSFLDEPAWERKVKDYDLIVCPVF